MEFTYKLIIKVIEEELKRIDDVNEAADWILRAELKMFKFNAESFYYEEQNPHTLAEYDFEIPKHWEEYFIKHTDEYKKYLELLEKFKNV